MSNLYKDVALSNPTEEEKIAIDILIDNDQNHIFKEWEISPEIEEKRKLLKQIISLDKICTGGLKEYVSTCKRLLKESSEGGTPLKGWIPSVPKCISYSFDSVEFNSAEKKGLDMLSKTGFVLVAGGLGERLGYSGIKLALKCELITETSFLGLYAKFILSYQKRSGGPQNDDTHDKTVELLAKEKYFGLDRNQITLLKQEKVPSIMNHSAHFAMDSKFEILTKPHGHGDVHKLLLNSILSKWSNFGVKYIFFFQDTNPLVLRGLPCLLGSSLENDFDINFLVIPRRPGEAVGSFSSLKDKSSGVKKIANVEYNVFENLLKSNGLDDLIDEKGYSSYPGNANVFILRLEPYLSQIQSLGGRMPEYINPKYSNKQKGIFKSPARLECAMADYSLLLPNDEKVGCTSLERWLCFSPAKNNISEAIVRQKATGFAESISSAESAIYFLNRKFLSQIGVKIRTEGPIETFKGLEVDCGAKVLLEPSFGVTFEEIRRKFKNISHVEISDKSTLILSGENIFVESIRLDGVLSISERVEKNKKSVIRDLNVVNKGWRFEEICENEKICEDSYLRGYKVVKDAEIECLES